VRGLGSLYRSGRSPDWLKFKNPDAPAVKREAEEDWRCATNRLDDTLFCKFTCGAFHKVNTPAKNA
jgi:hypothetical protein